MACTEEHCKYYIGSIVDLLSHKLVQLLFISLLHARTAPKVAETLLKSNMLTMIDREQRNMCNHQFTKQNKIELSMSFHQSVHGVNVSMRSC